MRSGRCARLEAARHLHHGLLALVAVVLATGACHRASPTSPTSNQSPRSLYVSGTGNDASAGTIDAPWLTLRHAVGQLRAGDTLNIRGGTYREQLLEVGFGAGGSSWTSPITIAGYPGETVTLRPVTGQGNVVRFQDGAVSYVVLERLVLDGISAGGGEGGAVVYLGPTSHHIRLSNVEITNGDGNGLLGAGNRHEFINLNVHRNGLFPGYTNSNGMYLTTSDSTVDGGDFHDNEAYGIRVFDSDTTRSANNNTIRRARVYGNGFGVALNATSVTSSGGGGIVMGDTGNVVDSSQVYGNYNGISVFGFKPASAIQIRNNTVYGNVTFGIDIQSGARNTEVMNNSVYANGKGDIVDLGAATVLSGNRLR